MKNIKKSNRNNNISKIILLGSILVLIFIVNTSTLFAFPYADNAKNYQNMKGQNTRENNNQNFDARGSGSRFDKNNNNTYLLSRIQQLKSGTLSSQEGSDFNAIYADLKSLDSLITVSSKLVITDRINNETDAIRKSKLQTKLNALDSRKYSLINNDILNYIANRYSIKLDTSAINVTANSLVDTLQKMSDLQIKLVNSTQAAYSNTDDADLKALYSLLQVRMIRGLGNTNTRLMYEGGAISPKSTEILNRNNTTLIAYDSTNAFGIKMLGQDYDKKGYFDNNKFKPNKKDSNRNDKRNKNSDRRGRN